MKFLEAVDWASKNQHLVGTKHKGSTIDELIVYPTGEDVFTEFKKDYLTSFNPEKSIAGFTQYDCSVAAVFNKRKARSVFFIYGLRKFIE